VPMKQRLYAQVIHDNQGEGILFKIWSRRNLIKVKTFCLSFFVQFVTIPK
jgi:hypothetical protein